MPAILLEFSFTAPTYYLFKFNTWNQFNKKTKTKTWKLMEPEKNQTSLSRRKTNNLRYIATSRRS